MKSIKEAARKFGFRACLFLGLCMPLFGCSGVQFPITLELHSVGQDDSALATLVENRSSFLLRVMYPLQSTIFGPSQFVIFPLPYPGIHRLVVAAFQHGRHRWDEPRLVATLDIPMFLNGHELYRVKGRLVGHHVEVTDGLLVPYR